jgi:hypothetical protein
LPERIVNSLLLIENVIDIDGFQTVLRVSSSKVLLVITIVDRFVLGPFAHTLAGFEYLSGVAAVVVDWRAPGHWRELLRIELDVVHLQVPFWSGTVH